MKKIVLGLVVLSSGLYANESSSLYFKAGLDVAGRFQEAKFGNSRLNETYTDKDGYELAIEATDEFYPNLELGVGIAYQNHGTPNKRSNYSEIEKRSILYRNTGYQSVPLYLTGKYNIPLESLSIKPYLKVDFGYSFNFGENNVESWIGPIKQPNMSSSISNGFYYGAGVGMEYNNFIMELMYKTNKADIEYKNSNGSFKQSYDYTRTTLAIGYKFNF